MKSFDNCPLKRSIQATLFPKRADIVLGLSSPKICSDYLQVLPKYKELYLVNYVPEDEIINANSLSGMLDVLINKGIHPDFIDADFCSSCKTSGIDLLYIYYKCLTFKKPVTIGYSFAIRGTTLEKTMKWLETFPSVHTHTKSAFNTDMWEPRQYAYKYGNMIHYRESGEQMITGIINISKNSHK
jgi:hypothetical protein